MVGAVDDAGGLEGAGDIGVAAAGDDEGGFGGQGAGGGVAVLGLAPGERRGGAGG